MEPAEPGPIQRELRRMRNRIVWSVAGWRHAWATEHSFRSWVYANILSAVLAFYLPLPGWLRLVILVLGLLILAAELLNTAIERVTDLTAQDQHDLARQAKDAGSAGVFVTAVAAGAAWVHAAFVLAS